MLRYLRLSSESHGKPPPGAALPERQRAFLFPDWAQQEMEENDEGRTQGPYAYTRRCYCWLAIARVRRWLANGCVRASEQQARALAAVCLPAHPDPGGAGDKLPLPIFGGVVAPPRFFGETLNLEDLSPVLPAKRDFLSAISSQLLGGPILFRSPHWLER